MQILFGPENDHPHVDSARPGAYEWWYFDALSGGSRYALTAIFFVGTPMSPYYVSVVRGRQPLPRDWCGVFFTLHDRAARRPERAYAYNLYRRADLSAAENLSVAIGRSHLTAAATVDGWTWRLKIDEPGLWTGRTTADLTFHLPRRPKPVAPIGDPAESHTWICAAPRCAVNGTVQTPSGEILPFTGDGYHDHNFGVLPWAGIDSWYWSRTHHPEPSPVGTTIVYYALGPSGPVAGPTLFEFDRSGEIISAQSVDFEAEGAYKNRYGAYQIRVLKRNKNIAVHFHTLRTPRPEYSPMVLSDGPFYRRLVTRFVGEGGGPGLPGIGEVFLPARLCGPLASRAIWTRMRRRK